MSRNETNETPSRTTSDWAPRRPSWRRLKILQPRVFEIPPGRHEHLEPLDAVAHGGPGGDEIHRRPRRVLHRLALDLHPQRAALRLVRRPVRKPHLAADRRIPILGEERLLPRR